MVRLSRALDRAFGVAVIRLALGTASLGAAVARGASVRSALLGAVLGGVVLTLIALGQSSRAGLRAEPEALPMPGGAVCDPPWRAALLACVPSTIGVAVMTVIALAASAVLAAVLAGVMLSLGVLAVVSGVEIAALERREGTLLYLGRGPRPGRYSAPRRDSVR